MITVKTESALQGGMVRRRYKVTLTDLLGDTHVDVLGMFNHLPENDGSDVELQLIASKKEQEKEQYKDDIRNGSNPFSAKVMLWNTRNEMLKSVLDEALSQPATDPIVYNGLPYLSAVTDDELMALYYKDQLWVDDVRAKATGLLSAKSNLDSYQAVL